MFNPEFRMKWSVVFFLALAACLAPLSDSRAATSEINVPSTLTHVMLTKATVAPEITKCLPSINQAMLTDITNQFPQSGAITTVQNNDGFFVVADTNGYCIKKSANNHPILPVEAFYKTANPPSEVPTDVKDKLYREISTLIAKKGSAKVAFVFDNGNAMIVDYSVKNVYLLYPHYFKKAGEWESENIDIRFSDARMNSFDTTQYNNKAEKQYLLAHR